MPAGKPTIASNTQAGGHEPQPSPRAAAVSRIQKMKMAQPHDRKRTLSHAIKSALVMMLDEGELREGGHFWRAPSGRRIVSQTVYTMFERGFIMLIYRGRSRRKHRSVTDQTRVKHTIGLTEVGRILARGLKSEWEGVDPDNYESSNLVYGDAAE